YDPEEATDRGIKSVVVSLYCNGYDPRTGGSHGNPNPTTRVRHAAQRCGGHMAARGPCAASDDAGDWGCQRRFPQGLARPSCRADNVFLAGYARPHRPRRVPPHAEAAFERIGVVANAAPRRQLFQVLDVPAAEHDVVGLERGDEALDHITDMLPPLLLAPLLQPAVTHVVLVGALLVRKVTELHGPHDTIQDQRRAEPSP